MPEKRRHAAIMFTDIVGYTAMMGDDEEKAFAILARNRKLHQQLIKKYNGSLIKEMGDGTLAGFPLASEAVRCAIEIQQKAHQNQIPLKIGIHEGELVFMGKDVLGDGVNVASRLQDAATEGSILISGAVYRDTRNKPDIDAEFIGERSFKNVEEPVRVYEVKYEPAHLDYVAQETPISPAYKILTSYLRPLPLLAATLGIILLGFLIWWAISGHSEDSSATSSTERPEASGEKGIAVIPFRNESQEVENEYFANGIMEGILNNLAKISSLRVPGRTSVEQFRDTTIPIPEIVKMLNVDYVLEGSVRRSGSDVRIHVQLINSDDRHIWSDVYDRKLDNVLAIESEIAQLVAKELEVLITREERDKINRIPEFNIGAYDYFQRGRDEHIRFWLDRSNREALDKAISLYRQALQVDSTFAQGYTGLGLAYRDKYERETFLQENYLDSALKLSKIALSFNDQLEEAYLLRGEYFLNAAGDPVKARTEFNKALEINPNYVPAYRELALIAVILEDDHIKGLQYLQKALQLEHGPELGLLLNILSIGYGRLGFNHLAREYLDEKLKLDHDTIPYNQGMAFIEITEGNIKGDIEYHKKNLAIDPTYFPAYMNLVESYTWTGDFNRARNYLDMALEFKNNQDQFELWEIHRIGHVYWHFREFEKADSCFNLQIEVCQKSIQLKRLYFNTNRAYYDLAAVYCFLGNRNLAYAYLDKLNEISFFPYWILSYLEMDPLLEPIRQEERFRNFLLTARMKFQREHDRVKKWLEENEVIYVP